MDILEAKNLVIKAGKELVKRGLISRTWGNVSCRIDSDKFVITPSGRDYQKLTNGEIVIVNINTLKYEGEIKPSSEKGAHAKVYKKKSNINFVIHTHQENASVVSACDLDFINTDKKFTSLKGEVLISGYGLPGTKNLSNKIGNSIENSIGMGIIMKNHGAICFGVDYEETFKAVIELEKACELFLKTAFKKNDFIDFEKDKSIYEYILSKNNKKYYEDSDKDFLNDTLSKLKKEHIVVNVEKSQQCITASNLGQIIKPMVDDFAQIIGLRIKVVKRNFDEIQNELKKSYSVLVEGIGAICIGNTELDVEARNLIVAKNCKAYLYSYLFGKPKPINILESKMMNIIYKKRYSKQI